MFNVSHVSKIKNEVEN